MSIVVGGAMGGAKFISWLFHYWCSQVKKWNNNDLPLSIFQKKFFFTKTVSLANLISGRYTLIIELSQWSWCNTESALMRFSSNNQKAQLLYIHNFSYSIAFETSCHWVYMLVRKELSFQLAKGWKLMMNAAAVIKTYFATMEKPNRKYYGHQDGEVQLAKSACGYLISSNYVSCYE